MKTGFIGLGNVGGKLAGSILRNGYDLTVRDLNRDLAEPFLARGARWAESPREMAEACDMVITCLPSPAACSAVMEAEDGILAGLGAGKIWAEMSTTDEAEVKRMADLVEAAKEGRARRLSGVGRLSSGRHRQHLDLRRLRARYVFERLLPVLTAMGRRILHTGPAGLGLGPQGAHQLPRHRQPGDPLRGPGDREGRRHGPQHDLRGDPHLLGQLLRPRDREPGDPERQPRHQLHNGPGGEGREPVPGRGRPPGLCRWRCRRCWMRDLQGRRDPLRRASEWSPNIVRRLEEATGLEVRAPGFPAEMVDDEAEAPGYEVVPTGADRSTAPE